jgi:hypothetical protein
LGWLFIGFGVDEPSSVDGNCLKPCLIGMEPSPKSSQCRTQEDRDLIRSIQTAVSGLQASANRFSDAAQRVVTASQPQTNLRTTANTAFAGDLARPRELANGGVSPVPQMPLNELPGAIVDMQTATHSYKANLAVLSVAQEMSRVILDRKA